jgi:peptidoglycan/xylan/chitin deacetylase (PgdA/CDA1 family)
VKYSERLADKACAIFLLHGVVEKNPCAVRNYNRKHIEREYFRAFLSDLKAHGPALSMDEVLEICERGEDFPDHSFAITFDDGFENNRSVAAPVLAELGMPATFYVTTRFVDENAMSWIDRIEAVFEDASLDSVRLPWESAGRPLRAMEEKIAVLDEIRRVVKRDPGIDLETLIADLSAQAGRDPVTALDGPLDRKLDWSGVAELSNHPLFIVGGHSHAHRILSFLGEEELRRDIGQSFDLLDRMAGVRSAHYAYPEGLEHCFNEYVISVLKAGGIRCCPTAIDGINRKGADPFRLRRIMVT